LIGEISLLQHFIIPSIHDPLIQINKGKKMPRVQLHAPAPDFTLNDFNDKPVRLADFRGKNNVVLVFNRGFS
jgi:hypothetical protein